MMKRLIFCLVLLSTLACQTETPVSEVQQEPVSEGMFELVSPARSGLNFSNTLQEGLNTNILMYEYFYNGAGVATADFNGDGLIDIFFTSNMAKNRLYLNKGNLTFDDVTSVAGIEGRDGPWKTGTTYADVNGDGKLDLYVCYSGTVKEENRANQLFINQGNDAKGVPLFKEQAKEYNIASVGYSNQGYFFDHDHDGDLDLLLLNHNPQSMPVLNEVSTKEILKQDDPLRGVRLFRQHNKSFEDVTQRSGIVSSALTYALGAGIADINGDGWDDIYICNDYAIPDYLYINQRNGRFVDKLQEMMGHTSHFSMGNDVADINNDGAPEIFSLDMLPADNKRQKLLMAPDNYGKFDLNLRSGFYYQYMRNMLHVNNGNGTFSEVGQIAGVSNTDWSWAALFADYDNDGKKDLFVTNGYLRDFTNLDFIKYMDNVVKTKGRLKRQDVLELISNMPSSRVNNYIYSNVNGLQFKDRSKEWGMTKPSNSNGAAYADLDNDGDLDLVVNNINEPAFLFENKTTGRNFVKVSLDGEGMNTLGVGAKVTMYANGSRQLLQQMPSRGYLSAVSPVLHFGLGNATVADSVVVKWPSGKVQVVIDVKVNSSIVLKEKDATQARPSKVQTTNPIFVETKSAFDFKHDVPSVNDFKRQPQLLTQLSFMGPVLVKGDIDGDGLEDFFAGGSNGNPARIFLQRAGGKFIEKSSTVFTEHKAFTDVAASFIDADKDGDADLFVASGGYHDLMPDEARLTDRLYLNDGNGNFSFDEKSVPKLRGSKACVAVYDFNQDGYDDIFVGGKYIPGRFPEASESALLVNKGDGTFDNKMEEFLKGLGTERINDVQWVDMNKDGLKDLVVAGEWMSVRIFHNRKDAFDEASSQYFDKQYSGWWNKIVVSDVNNDGWMDILGGNFGLNSQYKATDAEPIELFYSDFDNNGSVDPIVTTYIQGVRYPYLTRDEMLEQLGYLRSRFTDYKSYAGAHIETVIAAEKLRQATSLKVNHLETTLFLSDGNGKLKPAALPLQSQFSVVRTILLGDFDNDDNLDILLCGNDNRMKLKIGKMDANYGTLLRGDGKGQFEYVDQTTVGLKLKGDIGSALIMDRTLILGICGGKVSMYKFSRKGSGRGQIAQAAP